MSVTWTDTYRQLRDRHPNADVMELIWAACEACPEEPLEDRIEAGIERATERIAENEAVLADLPSDEWIDAEAEDWADWSTGTDWRI